MARSLFASLQHQKPKKSVIFEAQKDAFMTGELGNIHGDFHDFHRAFIFQNNTKINIGRDISVTESQRVVKIIKVSFALGICSEQCVLSLFSFSSCPRAYIESYRELHVLLIL